ncbi:MAG TPA: DUF3040 domain-containing protein [Streptosporangiaceae bacterium]|nr:DUF3040 domain-containing protein [Streptosporangiaceae bacterium]
MPLSEHEQRQLEQIEQALYADHPRLARAMRAKDPKVHYRRRVMQACIGFVVGVGVLVAGVILKHAWISAIGFVVMLGASMLAITSYRRMSGVTVDHRARGRERGRGRGREQGRRAPKSADGGMMDRLEERWRRRQERDR